MVVSLDGGEVVLEALDGPLGRRRGRLGDLVLAGEARNGRSGEQHHATMSAASHASTTFASPRIAVVTSVAMPKKPSSPATLNMPIPTPARLPFWATSACASRISERTSSGICWESWWTRAPRV